MKSTGAEKEQLSGLSDDEKDLCFYYEYARASKAISEGVVLWRKRVPSLHKIKILAFPAPKRIRDIKALSFRKAYQIQQSIDQANERKPVSLRNLPATIVDFVACFPAFPEKRWSELPKKLRCHNGFVHLITKRRNALRDHHWQAISDLGDWLDKPSLKQFSLPLKLQQASQSHGKSKTTLSLINICWDFDNDVIVEAFRRLVVQKRPARYEVAKRSDFRWKNIPFKKETALADLEVYQRYIQAGSWRQYAANWPQSDARLRQLKRSRSRAKKVLKLFEG
jgi:hypothetical protein